MRHELTQAIDNFDLPWFLKEPDPSIFRTGSWVVFDLETTNLSYGNAIVPENRVVSFAWATSDNPNKVHFRWGDEFAMGELIEEIKKRDFIVAHNAKFELKWLIRAGVDISDILVYDTMLAEKVLLGNNPQFLPLELGAVSSRYGYPDKEKIIAAMMKGGVSPDQMPRYLLRKRDTRDVWTTGRVFLSQRERLSDKLLAITYTRGLLTPVLADIEMQGLKLNKDRVYEEYAKTEEELTRLEREYEELTGGINPRSPKQKAEFMYDVLGFPELTKQGKKPRKGQKTERSTNKARMAQLRKYTTTQRQKKFFELSDEISKVGAAMSKTLDFLKRVVDERDGVFYGEFLQHIAQTHRLSSRGVAVKFADGKTKGIQFQNFPRDYKDLLEARTPGWVTSEADGSQLEFRVAAYLGQDPQAMFDIRNDEDIHRFTASVLNRIVESKVNKKQRQAAKPDTFKPLYGGQRGTKDQERYYEAFRKKYHVLSEEQKRWTYTVLEKKQLETPWGLIFYWPRTRMSSSGYIDNTPSIYNYPVQSLATAEIVPIAAVYMWHRIRINNYRIKLVNTVHDSVIGEHPPEETEVFRALAVQSFTFDVYDYLEKVYAIDFNVPLGCGVTTGSRWSAPDAEEIELNVERNGEYWHKGERANGRSS